MPPSPELGQTVLITLQKQVSAATLPVRYSYTLRNCGWRPAYVFDVQPDKGKGDAVSVRFMAEVWQFSGMDLDRHAPDACFPWARARVNPCPCRTG